MAKRVANKQLTQDNWEAEDPVEEAGIFEKANDEEIGKRIIRKAKRVSIQKDDSVPKSGPFASFTGFSAKTDKRDASGQPSLSSAAKPLTNGSASSFSGNVQMSSSGTAQLSDSSQDPEYFLQLKVLNECFLGWVQKYVASSPCCDFTPVFRDYENYLTDIDRRFKNPTTLKAPTMPSKGDTPFKLPVKTDSTATSKSFKFDMSTNSNNIPVPSTQFKFDSGVSGVNTKPSSGLFTFGSASAQAASAAPLPGFFKPPPSVTVEANTTATKEDPDLSEQSEDTYEPPKNDVAPVEESDAIYSKRCKLFFKKGETFTDKGVGTLYLKSLTDKDQVQLLFRADTATGLVLLNRVLTTSIPVSRAGKNNVLVCVPNPPDSKSDSSEATSLLLRVKTAEEADELADTLKKHQS